MRLRTGRKQPKNLYLQYGEQPSDDDTLIGQIQLVIIARRIVDRWNAHELWFDGDDEPFTDY